MKRIKNLLKRIIENKSSAQIKIEAFSEKDNNARQLIFNDKEIFDKIISCFEAIREPSASTVKKNALVNVVLGLILENGEFIDSGSAVNNELISKILLYLNDNYKQNITPLTVAQHFGYSQS